MTGVGAMLTRTGALALSIGIALGAGLLFLQFGAADGLDGLDILRALLIVFSTFWLAWGASQALLGLMARVLGLYAPRPFSQAPITGRTAILMPVCNEDPFVTFARIAAMDASLAALGLQKHFDFAILSDTRDEDTAGKERQWFTRLLHETGGEGRIFYRRRSVNTGRKAGNIEDFFQRSGAAYDYALILDADSLMEGATIAEMVRRMQETPDLGLLQTLPVTICAGSRFGRAMQFSATFYSPVFARGLAMMQGRTGPFWGHNAMVRVGAFAASCGLPELAGKPPFGGHILSHDYVEAALLARAGWQVRLDPDLTGSYEEGPENIVDYAKRDRRWCQGNLQHSRLLAAPGLKPWSRFVFFQGILAYIAPLFWMTFLWASVAAIHFAHEPDYFPDPYQLFPVFPSSETSKAIGLAIGVFGLLVLPKLLIALGAALSGRARGFGGAGRAFCSTLSELLLSSVIAPVMLMYQTRAVFQVLMGRDGGWPPNRRGDGSLHFADAWAASRWIMVWGVLGMLVIRAMAPGLVLWLLPVGLPMILAPLLIWWSSHPGTAWLYRVPQESAPSPVMAHHHAILARWHQPAPVPSPALAHV